MFEQRFQGFDKFPENCALEVDLQHVVHLPKNIAERFLAWLNRCLVCLYELKNRGVANTPCWFDCERLAGRFRVACKWHRTFPLDDPVTWRTKREIDRQYYYDPRIAVLLAQQHYRNGDLTTFYLHLPHGSRHRQKPFDLRGPH